VLDSRGFRLSVAGGLAVAVSLASLLVLPGVIAGAGMMTGAVAVIAGFLWTIFEYYGTQPPGEE
jgi:hypothetical protein